MEVRLIVDGNTVRAYNPTSAPVTLKFASEKGSQCVVQIPPNDSAVLIEAWVSPPDEDEE